MYYIHMHNFPGSASKKEDVVQTRREKARAGDPRPKASPVDEFPPENVRI